MNADYDSPWKEALDAYFEPFVLLLFPAAHANIDWSRGCEFLDKEFQQIVREAELGRRHVDKLVKVWTKVGIECWVLIHIEVQTTHDSEFPLRMYVYNYRVFDRYNKPVASFAVLADDDPAWRPADFRRAIFDCEVGIRFPAVKLLDLAARQDELEASANPFSKIVLAHLKARQTKDNPAGRDAGKLRLVRGLYECGLEAAKVRELLRLIDWLLVLPPPLEFAFDQDVEKLPKEKSMPYVTSFERVGRREGMRKGIQSLLRVRFGAEGLKLMPEIEEIHEDERLEQILTTLETAGNLDEVRRIWSADTPSKAG